MKVNVGDKVYIPTHVNPFKVQARDERFIICTKPFNPKRTVLYFIVDLKTRRRGPDNMIFCSGYNTKDECEDRLKELQEGKIEVSYRHGIDLDLDIQ